MVEKVNGSLVENVVNRNKLYKSFFVDALLHDYLDNLKKLRGLMFEWGRNDINYDHVHSNQTLTRNLTELGIKHEALETNGNGWDYNYEIEGSIYRNMLPFFMGHMKFTEEDRLSCKAC